VYPIPYANIFSPGSSGLACWNGTSGTINAEHRTNYVNFDWSNSGGTSILISPKLHITSKAFLTYSWNTRPYVVSSGAVRDSLNVSIKAVGETTWTTLKKHKAPLLNTNNQYAHRFEDMLIDPIYINDTIQVRFEYFSVDTNSIYSANYAGLDNFQVVPEPSDSVFVLPYQESFDGASWRPDSSSVWNINWYKIGAYWRSVPWERDSVFGFKWVVANDSTTSVGTGPAFDHSGTGNYLYSEASGSSNSDALVYSPYLNLGQQRFPECSFWYHMRGATMGTLFIEQWVGSNWKVLDSISGQQQMKASDPWLKHTLLIDSASLSQLRFRMKKNPLAALNQTFLQDAAIDDLEIYYVACPLPNDFDVSFSNVTNNAATVNWTAGLAAGDYRVEYGPTGFAPGNGVADTVSSASLNLVNLQQQTVYDVYLQMLCGASDTSRLQGPYSFKTGCSVLQAPFVETFDDALVPFCWFAHNQLGPNYPNGTWKTTKEDGFPFYGAQGQDDHTGNGGYAIGVDGSAPMPLDSIALYSPRIDISGLIKPELSFWLYSNNTNYPGENNSFYLDIFDGAQWQYNVLSYAGDSADWVAFHLDLKQFTVTGPIQVRLVIDKDSLNAAWYNDIVLDDFSIVDKYGDECALPVNVMLDAAYCTSAQLSWVSDTSNVYTRIKYGPVGFNLETAGTWLQNTSSPHMITGLQPGSSYDAYVVDSCSNGLGIQKLSFSTQANVLPVIRYTTKEYSATDTSVTYLFDARSSIDAYNIEWKFGGTTLVPGDTALWTFYNNHNHWFTISASNACGTFSDSFSILVSNITLEEHQLQESITLYPNPAQHHFTVSCKQMTGADLQLNIWNEVGGLVHQQPIRPTEERYSTVIKLPQIAPGFYMVQIQGPHGGSYWHKLVVRE
jgi:hypothetical protein